MSAESKDVILTELIADCLALKLAGEEQIPFDEICREHPELLEEVRQGVEKSSGLAELQTKLSGRDALVGKLLDARYRMNGRLGAGAMGVVYDAHDLELNRSVAIKVIHTAFLDRESVIARFEREASSLAAVQHDAIVTIFDRGVTEDGAPFIVMEKIDGVQCSNLLDAARRQEQGDSTDWLVEEFGIEPLSEPSFVRQSLRWTADLASALQAAHRAGIYHRDVKPSNIMIRKDGRPVLLDFGIAAHEDHATLTETNATVGTPAYMAPEALRGRVQSRPSLDVYGLAATLYHLVTLRPPYQGTPTEILARLATQDPRPAVKINPGLPRGLQALLDAGLARRPSARYASAEAMQRDVESLLAFQPIERKPISTVRRFSRQAISSHMFKGALAATLVLAALAGSILLERHSDQQQRVQFGPAWQAVPANLGAVNAENRFIHLPLAQAEIEGALNELVDVGLYPVEAYTLRGTFLWDQGRRDEGCADFAKVAALVDTSFARAWEKGHASIAEGDGPLDLALLPEPETPEDRYLATYSAIRASEYVQAIEWSDQPLPEGGRHARELRLFLDVYDVSKRKSVEQAEAAAALLQRIRAFEVESGLTSPTTAHLRSYAHERLHSPGRSLAAAREALSMSPHSHVSLLNASKAAYELHWPEPAERYARKGLALLPDYTRLRTLAVKALALAEDHEGARRLIEERPFPDTALGQRQKVKILAFVSLDAAASALRVDPELAKAPAREAIEHVRALSDESRFRHRVEAYASGIISGDRPQILAGVLADLRVEADTPRLLRALLEYWPEDPSPEQGEAIRRWIAELHELKRLQNIAGRTLFDDSLLTIPTDSTKDL